MNVSLKRGWILSWKTIVVVAVDLQGDLPVALEWSHLQCSILQVF